MEETFINNTSPIKLLGKKHKNRQNNTPIQDKNKSIFEFFDSNKSKTKNRPIIKKNRLKEQNDNYHLISKYSLIRNPSTIRRKDDKVIMNNQININNIQLFNEEMLDDLFTLLSPIKDKFNNSFNLLSNKLPISYKTDDYLIFINNNIQSIIIKFFLQLNDNTIFIPKDYLNKKLIDSSKIALITGINTIKYFSLQYNSVNVNEAKIENLNLFDAIKNYIRLFKYNKTNNKTQQALVLYHPHDYNSFINLIELICKSFDYQILCTNELENQKVNRLNKIAEATKSERITCLPENVNEKLKIIEALSTSSSNDNWKKIVKMEPMLDNINKNYEYNNNHQNNTKEENAYSILEKNIFKTCFTSKTLILVIDSFNNSDDDKTYLNNITSTIPQSKCPIIILTNNIIPFKYMNQNNTFTFEQIQNDSQDLRKYYLFLLTFAFFLHLTFDNLNKDNNNNIGFEEAKKQIKTKLLTEEFIIDFDQFYISNRIIKLVLFLLCEYLNNLNKCQIILFSALKQVNHIQSINDKLFQLEKIIFKEDEKEEVIVDINKPDDIKSIVEFTEEESLNDKKIGEIDQFKKRQFTKLKGINGAETIVNCENYLIDYLFSSHISNIYNERKKEAIFSNEFLFKRKNEDKKYHNYHFSSNHLFVSNQNYYYYNALLLYLNNLEVTKLSELFNIRLPRSSSKNNNYSESINQTDKMKQMALNKFLRDYNVKEFNRFIKAHTLNEVCYSFSDLFYINKETLYYFTDYNQLNELNKIIKIYKMKYDSDSFINDEEDIEEDFE